MKKIIILVAILYSFTFASAQVNQIDLDQETGKFTTEHLALEAGSYTFNINNNGVDHEVGFVLVPKGLYDAEHHIKAAYVKAPVATGSSSLTDVVNLTAGEYEYFCPLNPTPKYSLTVHERVEMIKLSQTPGEFMNKNVSITEGAYQFEIANKGVGHEVGFVLVPKGKYEPEHHIKAAYVKAPVPNGGISMTSVVELEAGEYEYFCPLNPTPKYGLVVNEKVEMVKFEQTPGVFSNTSVALSAGTYQFEIANAGVAHEVGFVLVPKGKYDPANHIKAAYVKAPVANGSSSMTSVIELAAGEYEYFCPLNPTPKYTLMVHDKVETIKLEQTPGTFDKKNVSVPAGVYQFEIGNAGVAHEVGFVLVPKGKYDPANHIKAAYVKAPVANGSSSMTSVVELEAGEYEYFCPLNPTPKYNLTVTK